MLRHFDDESGVYYNLMNERFFPFTSGLMNAVDAEMPIVEYDTNRTTFVTVMEEYQDELVKVEVECFIILNAFNSIEEAVTYKTSLIINELENKPL